MNTFVGFVKVNKKGIIKKGLIFGGALALAIVAFAVIPKNGEELDNDGLDDEVTIMDIVDVEIVE